MTQPKALFLADVMHNDPCSAAHHDEAAFELRRLYAENERIGPLAERVLELKAQRDALLEALKKALENGCATVYANEDDECGERGCCGVVSYKPHADDCWVTTARAAIKAVEEGK